MKNEADAPDPATYIADMLRDQIAQWVRDAIATSGQSAAEIGRRLGSYGLELNRSAMSELQNGKRQLQAVEMLALSEITGAQLPGQSGIVTKEQLSPDFLRALVQAMGQEVGLSAPEAERLAATVLEVARRLEGRKESDDYLQSLRLQVEPLALMFFPDKKAK